MKRLALVFLLFSGCKPTELFLSPNEVTKEKVVLYFRDHSTRKGEINISLENYSSQRAEFKPFVGFTPEGKTTEEKISLYDIEGYTMGPDFYALKKLDLYLDNTLYLLFVKRLTAEDSKIQLYELYETGRGNYTGDIKYSYYLSPPSADPLETFNTRSSFLVPHFDQKMSRLVVDCPELAEKIMSRQHGYFLPMGSFKLKTHPEVLMRIINEYNQCH